ncbi:MAG: PIN domain-containing protein [Acidobacteria bacterium]|nr:PIN domain-containing protein [Acidobacteriota bacterium]
MTAVDTSVVVAGFATWHEAHASAAAALARKPRIPAHVLVESFSVLTRLPPPHRAAPGIVATFLAGRFANPPLVLPASEYLALVKNATAAGLAGGAIYDALIAATVRAAGATLLTRDERARAVYDRLGVRYELIA